VALVGGPPVTASVPFSDSNRPSGSSRTAVTRQLSSSDMSPRLPICTPRCGSQIGRLLPSGCTSRGTGPQLTS
jgi:hypothetical protein